MEDKPLGFSPSSQLNLNDLNREELEARVLQLESHNYQLKNLLAKSEGVIKEKCKGSSKKKLKEFDFSKHSQRHILLQFLYLGWDRQGFTVQDDSTNTIEHHLFDALMKIKLIASRETSNYHRCGRTDKGVSAYNQVISITVRSNFKPTNEQLIDTRSLCEEINYPKLLNTVLPPDIRVLSWSPATPEFSARFDCTSRTYKYFFPKGNLDLKLMNEAAHHLIGEHDFRNFCKMDVGNGVIHYMRRITEIYVEEVDCNLERDANEEPNKESRAAKTTETEESYRMFVATIKGKAFLWHQIRAIMTILILVGEGNESPDVVRTMLDVTAVPRKPVYALASEVGLNLYKTEYEDNANWCYEHENLYQIIGQLQAIWAQHAIKATMLKYILDDISQDFISTVDQGYSLPMNQARSCIQEIGVSKFLKPTEFKTSNYKLLLERPTCQSLKEKVTHLVKKRRLSKSALEDISKKDKS